PVEGRRLRAATQRRRSPLAGPAGSPRRGLRRRRPGLPLPGSARLSSAARAGRRRAGDEAPILSERALNRTLLARQLLLERSTGSIVEAVEQVGGLQTQYAPSGYVGLWTRVAGFERDDLTRA